MERLLTLLAALFVCSPALAASFFQLYTCERPAWNGKEGCGDNNTYSTHTFLVDKRNLRDEQPKYVYQGGKGCDVSKKPKYTYHLMKDAESITFIYAELPKAPRNKLWTRVVIDLNTMNAVMQGVDDSPNLTCRVEDVVQ